MTSLDRPIRVLLIDDDEDDRLLTTETLEDIPQVDYAVTEVSRWQDGLDLLVNGEHDVALLDWHLGARNGLDVLREAREAGSRTPAILLTGLGSRDLDLAAMEAGAADYLPKTELSVALLERAVRYAINQAATLRRLEVRTEELHASNEELERFAAVVGHDLRNPMNTIAGYAELLEMQYRGKLDDRADLMLERLISGVSRLNLLITDLLEYSRVNGPPVDRDEVSLDGCLDVALSGLESRIAETGARIHREPLPVVRGSTTLLTQVLANLIANALKFCDGPAPEVWITPQRSPSGGYDIAVRDNGIGIKDEDQERIFTIFQRGQGVAQTPGTGIGLALCRRIVERHGGALSVRSTVGRGSTFVFTLPGPKPGDGPIRDQSAPHDAV